MAGPWHHMEADEVLRALGSSQAGLPIAEAGRRLIERGPNRLALESGRKVLPILFRQLTDIMILILLAAAVIAWSTGDRIDSIMILILVALNAALGFGQEYRAEGALGALKRLEQPQVVVRREGGVVQISSQDLVPGDVVALNEGQRVPADGRLIEAVQFQLDESQLTGESVAVSKHVRPVRKKDLPPADQINRVFMGTTAVTGHAWAVVTETGMKTELGKIAHLLRTEEVRPTPLQARLAYLGKWLAGAALVMTGLIFIAGLLRGEPLDLMLLTAISLAVAVIPEGLPAVVAIVLALGAQGMVRRNALIRKLPAVETLGSVTAICSDKTGTLTRNVMSVELIVFDHRTVNVTGNGYIPDGKFYDNGKEIRPQDEAALVELLRAAALCTNARLSREGEAWTVLGDPTEGALLVAAAKAGLWKEKMETEYPRVFERPFDSGRKIMTTVHRDPDGRIRVFTKGSMEEILRRTAAAADGREIKPMTRSRHDEILRIHRDLASDGVRVLACATRSLGAIPSEDASAEIEERMVFLGLIGMMDPPRTEARAAVARCRAAGIRPIMITGDHRITAEAIAVHLGIQNRESRVLTGEELDSISAVELESLVLDVSVYARVAPEQKLKIIRALKSRGQIVAMTGDGVNDAPALRGADIGIAMGKGGTDVAREASDLVLLDDNFATIIAAVEEGRIIYDNIRKFTRYMLSTNSGEILTMFFAILFGLPLPLLPVQILWMNLVTDGLPALALGVEPAERDTLKRPPRNPQESIFAGGLGFHILWVGLLMGLAAIAVFHAGLRHGLLQAQTMVFLTLTLFQMFHVLAIRSEKNFLWTIGPFSNPHLLGAILLTLALQSVITYHPVIQPVFHTVALSLPDLAACIVAASTVYFAVEGEKWARYRRGGTT